MCNICTKQANIRACIHTYIKMFLKLVIVRVFTFVDKYLLHIYIHIYIYILYTHIHTHVLSHLSLYCSGCTFEVLGLRFGLGHLVRRLSGQLCWDSPGACAFQCVYLRVRLVLRRIRVTLTNMPYCTTAGRRSRNPKTLNPTPYTLIVYQGGVFPERAKVALTDC